MSGRVPVTTHLQRATERIDDRSTRMLVRGNIAEAQRGLAEAVQHLRKSLDDDYEGMVWHIDQALGLLVGPQETPDA